MDGAGALSLQQAAGTRGCTDGVVRGASFLGGGTKRGGAAKSHSVGAGSWVVWVNGLCAALNRACAEVRRAAMGGGGERREHMHGGRCTISQHWDWQLGGVGD